LIVGNQLYVQDRIISTSYQRWTINATPSYFGTYWTFPVTLIVATGSGLTNFPDNYDLLLGLISPPLQGPQGPQGPQGTNGTIGVNGATGPQGFQGATGPNLIRRNDFTGTFSYCGSAPLDTAESTAVWNITRINYSTTTPVSAYSVGAWTNRYSLTYV